MNLILVPYYEDKDAPFTMAPREMFVRVDSLVCIAPRARREGEMFTTSIVTFTHGGIAMQIVMRGDLLEVGHTLNTAAAAMVVR